MLEYVFFQEEPRKRFQEFLTGQGLAWTLEPGDLETLVIVDEAGMDHELAERVESVYDELFANERSLSDPSAPIVAGVDAEGGVVIKLHDGRAVCARVPQQLIQRVLTVVTAEELGILVEAVRRAVENPEEHAL